MLSLPRSKKNVEWTYFESGVANVDCQALVTFARVAALIDVFSFGRLPVGIANVPASHASAYGQLSKTQLQLEVVSPRSPAHCFADACP